MIKVKCNKCGNEFSKNNIAKHESSCNGTYIKYIPTHQGGRNCRLRKTCEKCGCEVTVQNFESHYRNCDGTIRDYFRKDLICSYCNEGPFDFNQMENHKKSCKGRIEQVGLDSRGHRKFPKGNFTCKFCGRFFENRRHCDLVQHEKRCIQNLDRKTGSWQGKHHSEETKIKIAQSVRNRLGENFRGFYNKEACEFIENINLQKELHFQHQLNGGEVQVGPYFLDGYDKERNLVFEYNEIGHYLKQEKIEKDTYRRNYIIKQLNCNFFIYNEKEQQFEEYNNAGLVRIFKNLDEW